MSPSNPRFAGKGGEGRGREGAGKGRRQVSDEVVGQLVDDRLSGVHVLGRLRVDLGVCATAVVKAYDATVGR